VRKSQAAHGVSVIEVERKAGQQLADGAPVALRAALHAASPFGGQGPGRRPPADAHRGRPGGPHGAGHAEQLRQRQDALGHLPVGRGELGLLLRGRRQPHRRPAPLGPAQGTASYRWGEHDERFDARKHPNEFHRFGWVVEIDPMDPTSTPIKRTALGRAAHEGAWVAVTKDGRAVVYSGEDARFEYIYKFVSRDRIAARRRQSQPPSCWTTARCTWRASTPTARGRWLPLVHGQGPLTAANGFADQGEVLIKARQASDLLGATKMDRPEWLAIDPATGEVYCTLTNNSARGAARPAGVDAANPRANNTMGQIIRWKEDGDFDGAGFAWNHLVLAGDPANSPRPEAKGNIKGDIYACPDGIAFDPRGTLWIQTDAHATQMYKGEFANIGNNQMLACDPATGETRRFLTGPTNCEITGVAPGRPTARTMFINVQHPGETPSDRSDPASRASTPTGPTTARRPAAVGHRRDPQGWTAA
jgi:secreted PhoX family phosphatase